MSQPAPLSLPAALGVRPGDLVAFTGAGGKTSLMFALAEALGRGTVVTITTRIFAAQIRLAPAAVAYPDLSPDAASPLGLEPFDRLGALLATHGRCLVVGEVAEGKALGLPAELPAALLARPDVAYVLVEADGSRMRPCKAPAEHEPVIPAGTTLVVPVAGIAALGRPLREACHRPELVAELTGLAADEPITAAALATLIAHPQGGLKGVPAAARAVPFLNQVETAEQLAAARRVAWAILRLTRLERAAIGAARAARPVLEVQRPVTAAVLAAGESRRMGRNKLLLPWGETTVLGQTLRNLSQAAAHDVVVVSGHDAGLVEGIAADHRAAWLHNPDYGEGEMLSSLQLAVRSTAPRTAAVLVVLADQPMVRPETIDRLLVAFWQGKGEVVAPVYEGQRGNPVLIGRPFFDELLALPAGSAPRDLLGRHPEAIHLVEVETAAVLQDLDDPEQYERWRPGR